MRTKLLGLTLIVALILVMSASILTGSFDISLAEIFEIIQGKETEHATIFWQLRLPRMLLSVLAGAILSLSGFYMQLLVKNPLADPYIMGISSGAGFGVNLILTGLIPIVQWTSFTVPIFAWIGGFCSVLFVMGLSFRKNSMENEGLLLAGVATSSLFTALTGLLIFRFTVSGQVQQIIFWTFGSFEKATLSIVEVVAVLFGIIFLFGWLFSTRLDILMTGEIQAHSVGIGVKKTRIILLVITSLCAGGLVAFTGPVGFVGMMIPHFSRKFWGSAHKLNVVWGSVLGGTYLCFCDTVSRWILPPAGLPIGIVTALLGVPFFLYLLISQNAHTFDS